MGYRLNLPRRHAGPNCDRKFRYETSGEAERAIRGMWEAHRLMRQFSKYELGELRKLNAYECPCGGWHVGRTGRYVYTEEGPA